MATTTIITTSKRLIFVSDRHRHGNKIVVEDDILGHFMCLTDEDVSEILAATGAEEFILKETPHVEPLSQAADEPAGNDE